MGALDQQNTALLKAILAVHRKYGVVVVKWLKDDNTFAETLSRTCQEAGLDTSLLEAARASLDALRAGRPDDATRLVLEELESSALSAPLIAPTPTIAAMSAIDVHLVQRLVRATAIAVLGFEQVGKTSLVHALFPLESELDVALDGRTARARVTLQDRLLQIGAPFDRFFILSNGEAVPKEEANARQISISLGRQNLAFRFQSKPGCHEWFRRLAHACGNEVTARTVGIDRFTVRLARSSIAVREALKAPSPEPHKPSPTAAATIHSPEPPGSRSRQTFPVAGTSAAVKLSNTTDAATVLEPLMEYYSLDPELSCTVSTSVDAASELSIWDFAGQNHYYCGHHHYLPEGALYVVMYNCSQPLLADNGKYGAVFWLRTLLSRGLVKFNNDGRPNNLLIVGSFFDLYRAQNADPDLSDADLTEQLQYDLHTAIASGALPGRCPPESLVNSKTCAFVATLPDYGSLQPVQNAIVLSCDAIIDNRTGNKSVVCAFLATVVDSALAEPGGSIVCTKDALLARLRTYVATKAISGLEERGPLSLRAR